MSEGRVGHNRAPWSAGRMYAIVFDLDTAVLEQTYPNESWRNAYSDIRRVLEDYRLGWMQGSTYFGDETVNPVTCFLAVQELATRYPWFAPSVRDIRMLRIEENNDLMPVLDRASEARN